MREADDLSGLKRRRDRADRVTGAALPILRAQVGGIVKAGETGVVGGERASERASEREKEGPFS